MWSKQQAAVGEPPAASPSPAPSTPVAPLNQPSSGRLSGVPARGGARLGASIQIKGEVTGTEDLHIDGIVEGPIRIQGHELTVGPVDIKKDGSITGDISSARISIEDGAYFKGRIEIDPTKAPTPAE